MTTCGQSRWLLIGWQEIAFQGTAIKAEIDKNEYEKGIKVSDEEMVLLNIERESFHGEWNYKIMPQQG